MNDNVIHRVNKFLQYTPILSGDELLKHEFSDPSKKDLVWGLVPELLSSRGLTAGSSFLGPVVEPRADTRPRDDKFLHMLLYVRNLFKNLYSTVEGQECITQKSWSSSQTHGLQGGGVMTVNRGEVLEKSAVNMSIVAGDKYPGSNTGVQNDEKFAGKPFIAAGVSLISHPKNPLAPIIHFNIRSIKVFDDHDSTQWIGGGADLTPMMPFEEDTKEFHDALKTVCQKHSMANYDHFKQWADEYFYIPHRKEMRGVGGIFFDFLPITSYEETAFLSELGQCVAHIYAKILARRVLLPYSDSLIEKHHYWRGRYAEFNLIYDRGTRFGLMSGGNHEAIFCSLPPQVRW